MWFIIELWESSVVFVLDISPLLDLWFTDIFSFCDVLVALKHLLVTVKHLPTMGETRVQSLDPEYLLEKEMATYSSLPGKSHGQRSLVGYSPWGHKELDMTERFHFISWLFSFCGLPVQFFDSVFWSTKDFNFDNIQLFFVSSVSCALVSYLRNNYLFQATNIYHDVLL